MAVGHRVRGPARHAGSARAALRAALEFSPGEWRLLLPLIAAGFFEQYDTALLTLAAPTLSDGLGVSIATFGIGVAIVRLGALGGVPVLRLADRLGRRSVLLVSLAGFTLLTGLTAISWSLAAFVLFQTLARVFLAAEHNLAALVIAEEVRADRRGAALSVLGWISTTGPALVALLLLVVPLTPLDWRLFYVVALVPLLVVAWLRRQLGETTAFRVAATEDRVQPRLWPHVDRRHRGNLARLCLLVGAAGAVQTPTFLYGADLAQDGYDWDAAFTAIVMASGFATAFGFWVGGRASDRTGRRPALAAGLLLTSVAALLMFTEVRVLFVPGWFCAVAAFACLQAAVLAYVAELFPTEVRATLTAVTITTAIAAGSVGLLVLAVLDGPVGTSPALMVAGMLLVPFCLLLRRLPETAGADVIGARPAACPPARTPVPPAA
jgi:MFS family permease